MELIFRICLLITGVINLLPSVLAFIPSKISNSYGIELPDVNYELLLRHRAVLFGLVGGIMIYAAITSKYYVLATTIGLISMVSFVVLYQLTNGSISTELNKVMRIDLVGIGILLIGFVLYKFGQ